MPIGWTSPRRGIRPAPVGFVAAASGPVYDVASTAYFAAMSVQPSTARKNLINDLVVGLKADGVWPLLDWLLLCAAHDEQAGRVNAKVPSKLAVSTGNATPVPFTSDRGFISSGGAYLDVGEAWPAGGNFTQEAAHLGVWTNSGAGTAGAIGCVGSASSAIGAAPSGTAQTFRLHGNLSMNSTGALGHRIITRSGGNLTAIQNNSVIAGPTMVASTAPATVNGCVLRAINALSGDRVAAAHSGGPLSVAQAQAFYGRLNTYLTAVGGA